MGGRHYGALRVEADRVKFREITLIPFVFRDIYKKIKTTSESLYILKRLSNHLNKLVKSQK